MEDTKKLIEKYKRELMELSRRSPKSAPAPSKTLAHTVSAVPVVDDDPKEPALDRCGKKAADNRLCERGKRRIPRGV